MQNLEIKFADVSDCDSWNQYIERNSDNPCYLYYQMRDIIETEYRAKTLLLIAISGEAVVGILFAYHLNKSGSVLYTPEFGIVADSAEVISQLIAVANQYCVEYQLSKSCFTTGFLDLQSKEGLEKEWVKNTFMLDLTTNAGDLWQKLSGNARNKIRKAEKLGVTVVRGIQYFDAFYAVYVNCYLKKRLNIKSRSFFKKILDSLSDHVDLFVCLYEGKVVSGAIFLSNSKMTSYLFNASMERYRTLGVNDFLVWHAAKYYIEKDLSAINLGESNSKSGAYNFKSKQLKARPQEVQYFSYLAASTSQSLRTKIFEKMTVMLCRNRYLPSFLAKKLLRIRSSYGRFV